MSNLNTHFTPIDQPNWGRRAYFYYFTQMAPTGFSLTANLDVTATQAWAKTHHRKFNAIYLYLVSRILTQHPEMRIGRAPCLRRLWPPTCIQSAVFLGCTSQITPPCHLHR